MLNLKKGLALVLAAATAFTFAPVSTLSANAAATTSDDGFTKGTGIDSIDYSSVKLNESNAAGSQDGWETRTVLLKEHNDKSNNGTAVKGFKVSISRASDKNGGTDRYTVIKAENGLATDYSKDLKNTDITGSTVTQDTSWGTGSYRTSDFYFVPNVNGSNPNLTVSKTSADATLFHINGAYVKFAVDKNELAKTNDRSFKVTITSLDSTDVVNATELDKSEFTITLVQNGIGLDIDTSAFSTLVAENQDIYIPFRIKNPDKGHVQSVRIEDDGQNLARDWGYTDAKGNNTISYDDAGYIKSGVKRLHTWENGRVTVYVRAYGIDAAGKANQKLGEQSFTLTITPGNGHLYVSYDTDRDGRLTYTDDIALKGSSSANKLINYTQSSIDSVKDGTLKAGYVTDAANDWDTPQTFSSNLYTLPVPALTLTSDGTKTVKVDASAVAGANITYSLVGYSNTYDANDKVAVGNTTTTGSVVHTYSTTGDATDGTDADGNTTHTYTVTDHNDTVTVQYINKGYYNVYTESAASKYGAVDQNGLVTLKDTDASLYLVVTAQGSDATATAAKRATSTYIIPLTVSAQSPAHVYVTDDKLTGDSEAYYNGESYTGEINLSLTDRKSAELKTYSNAGDSYLKISSDKPDVVSVSGKTLTAHKEGKAVITVQNSASTQVSGVAIARLTVNVNKLLSTSAVSGKGVSVNKEKPYATIETSKTVSDASVVFDRDALYKVDKNYPAGYSLIQPKDEHYGDVYVTSTGHVSYQKNSGTVYVRCRAIGTKTQNPSPYVYIPVNYGQTVVDTELNVDQTPIVLDVKGTKQITATAATGTAISYKSADPSVASVDEKGLVTAVKSGYTTVTVTATSADGKTGDSAVITVIVKGNETISNEVKKPSKVTGIKVKNKKGAKVSVTWKAQDKSVLYRVYKKVGNGSWKAKNVTGAKATLDVKKGAKVTVKVKAFRRDANGKAVWQSAKATKAKAFKTDKK